MRRLLHTIVSINANGKDHSPSKPGSSDTGPRD
jgi:hypothetical protein